jgi:hypothetical protein
MSDPSEAILVVDGAPAPAVPIIPGFYPDPSICRVGDDFYLATSSFEYFPGVPIFHSTDLESWTQIGHGLTRRSQFPLNQPGASRGIYAPTLRHHADRFWLITTNVSDHARGQTLVSTSDPTAEWSEPVFIPEAIGIDPDLAWDTDGTCYLTWCALDFDEGHGGILQAPIDTATGRLLEPAYPVWQGTGMQAPEGPHLYAIAGTWYLLLAEGGTERGHSVTVARAPSPRGPFEPCPWNPILSHRSLAHPVQNVGHADLVEAPDGRWAAVHLGTRPRGSTPGFHVIGRETFLAGIDWIDGWPVFDETRYSPNAAQTSFADEFIGALDLRWVTPDSEPATVSAPAFGGGRMLEPRPNEAPALCVRVRDLAWTADAVFEESGSFRLRLDDRHWFGLRLTGRSVVAESRVGDTHAALAESAVSGDVVLRIRSVRPRSRTVPLGHAGPDDIELIVEDRSGSRTLATLDGRYVSTEVASGFTGRMLALGAHRDVAVVKRFRYCAD